MPGAARPGRRRSHGWAPAGFALLVVLALLAAGTGGSGATAGKQPNASPVTPPQFLGLAEAGVAQARRSFWNARLHWFNQRLSGAPTVKPLATLWSAFPLFEAIDAEALADPTAANRAAVRAFAAGAERYFNPNLRPVGGYAYYPGTRNPMEHTYFDDNGWWELAFIDAYRATGDRRDLRDAERAFRFIAVSGWDPVNGGVWWETLHLHKTSEPLAAEIYTGLALYRITGQHSYLETALRFLRWADTSSWNTTEHLVGRNATDGTVLDYVEGPMIGAELELCAIRHVHGRCAPAEALARASVAAFPREADWTPAADMIYLHFLLDLYETDGNPAWFGDVLANAEHAYRNARSGGVFFFKRWDGRRFPEPLLQPDAATLALFAWLGGAHAPH